MPDFVTKKPKGNSTLKEENPAQVIDGLMADKPEVDDQGEVISSGDDTRSSRELNLISAICV